MTATQSIFSIDRAVRAEAPAPSIYSFVPAGGADRARNVVRQISEAIRARLGADGDARTVLLANFLDSETAHRPSITCVDLENTDPGLARTAISASDAVFVVSATDPASIEDARAQAAWVQYVLRSLHRDEACGLLLAPEPEGVTAAEAEERTGLPVCGVLKSAEHIDQLALWIVQE